MTATHHTTTDYRQPTEPGALAAYEVRCTCGTVLSTSLSASAALRLSDDHLAWHARSAR